MAWTEPLFVLEVYVALGLLGGCGCGCGGDGGYRRAALVGVVVGLACLTRYTGVVLVPLALWHYRLHWRRALVFLGVSGVLFGGWLVRNLVVSGGLTGARIASETSLGMNLDLAFMRIFTWFAPLGAVPLVLVLVWCWVVWKCMDLPRVAFPMSAFVFCYLAMLVITSSLAKYDTIGNRLLAPIYPAVVVMLASCVNGGGWREKLFGALIAVWPAYLVIRLAMVSLGS